VWRNQFAPNERRYSFFAPDPPPATGDIPVREMEGEDWLIEGAYSRSRRLFHFTMRPTAADGGDATEEYQGDFTGPLTDSCRRLIMFPKLIGKQLVLMVGDECPDA